MKPWLVAALAVIVVVLIVALVFWPRPGPPKGAGDRDAAAPAAGDPGRPEVAAGAARPRGAPGRIAPSLRRRLTPEDRARLLEAVARAREAREASAAAGTGSGSAGGAWLKKGAEAESGPVATLDKEYVRSRVKEIVPLIKECYEMALYERAETSGKLTVRFVVSGEPGVGGVIEESEIVESEGIPEGTSLGECVRETMYAMEFEAPPGGGKVTVKYPFRFSSAESSAAPPP